MSTSIVSPLALIVFLKTQCEHQDQYPSHMWDIGTFSMATYWFVQIELKPIDTVVA